MFTCFGVKLWYSENMPISWYSDSIMYLYRKCIGICIMYKCERNLTNISAQWRTTRPLKYSNQSIFIQWFWCAHYTSAQLVMVMNQTVVYRILFCYKWPVEYASEVSPYGGTLSVTYVLCFTILSFLFVVHCIYSILVFCSINVA
jgi:hypothetical protein